MIDFSGKTAVVTGAAGYIGRKFCADFAQRGGACVLIDIDRSALIKARESLAIKQANQHFIYALDLSDDNEIGKFLQWVFDNLKTVDVLINNAAYTGESRIEGWNVAFENQTIQAWNAAMAVNLSSIFTITKGLVPLLNNSESPSIVNVASIYGFIGPDFRLYDGTEMQNPAAYAATKGGLIQLTRWLASSLAPKCRVNAVSPGGLFRNQPSLFVEKYVEKTPLGRMATEEDVSNCMMFLASEMASYINGQNIVVDGGYSIT